MIAGSLARHRHLQYLSILWSRLPFTDRAPIVNALSAKINSETPKGNWGPHLQMLKAFGQSGWESLPDITKMRLESLITEDILAGRHDIFGTNVRNSSGILGTWLPVFGPYFTDLNPAANHLITLLLQNWYTQNYVGLNFMGLLSYLADKTGKHEEFINALTTAFYNDARLVKNNLNKLPPEWIAKVQGPPF